MTEDATGSFSIAVLTVSDTRTPDSDRSGPVLCDRVRAAGHSLADYTIVRDEVDAIRERLRAWRDGGAVDLVLITGGTGISLRDVTPEAVHGIIDKELPGFGEMFRLVSMDTIGTSAMLSRAMAGVAGAMAICALPGSPGACRDAWDRILKEQLAGGPGSCNLGGMLRHLRRDLQAHTTAS